MNQKNNTMKSIPPKKLHNLWNIGLSRIFAAPDVDVGMGPETVSVYNGTTWPVKLVVAVAVVTPSDAMLTTLTHSAMAPFVSTVQFSSSPTPADAALTYSQDAASTKVAVTVALQKRDWVGSVKLDPSGDLEGQHKKQLTSDWGLPIRRHQKSRIFGMAVAVSTGPTTTSNNDTVVA